MCVCGQPPLHDFLGWAAKKKKVLANQAPPENQRLCNCNTSTQAQRMIVARARCRLARSMLIESSECTGGFAELAKARSSSVAVVVSHKYKLFVSSAV